MHPALQHELLLCIFVCKGFYFNHFWVLSASGSKLFSWRDRTSECTAGNKLRLDRNTFLFSVKWLTWTIIPRRIVGQRSWSVIAPFGAINPCCGVRKTHAQLAAHHPLVAVTTTTPFHFFLLSFGCWQILWGPYHHLFSMLKVQADQDLNWPHLCCYCYWQVLLFFSMTILLSVRLKPESLYWAMRVSQRTNFTVFIYLWECIISVSWIMTYRG